ncbi:MAG: hypothetical protein AAFU54_20075 [Chloroflexota bacterium]
MAEYIAFDKNVEVSGESIQSISKALGEVAVPILRKHGLYPIDHTQWYSQQTQLNVYREISDLNLLNMVAIGIQVPDTAGFPPGIETVHDALKLLNDAYQMHHRGGDFGDYRYEHVNNRQARMICRNPYPSDLDYGIIYRLVQKFQPAGTYGFYVELDTSAPSRRHGGDSCTYLITW